MKKKFLVVSFMLFLATSVFSKDFDAIYGNFKIVLNDSAGTYCLYVNDPRSEKFVPVLNQLNNSSKNKFYLKVGNTVYPLSKQDGVSSSHEFTQSGATLTYSVKNIADVKVFFTFVNSLTGKVEDADIVIVDILVTNISRVSKNVSVKAVFDTILGETYASHFSTEKIAGINTEAVFNSMEADKWIKSCNDNLSVKFLLDGPTISPTSNVSLANISFVSTDIWEPNLVPGRGFSSLFSIDNSAVAVSWRQYRLTPSAKCNVRFYITTGVLGDESPDTTCRFFTANLASENLASFKEAEKFINVEAVEYAILTSNDNKVEPVSSYKDNPEYANIPSEKLNQEYIDDLLHQIEEIQNNPDKYSQERITQLNLELDTILRMLGQ